MGHITNSVKYFGSFLTFVHAVVCVTIWGRDRRSHSLRGPVVGGAHRLTRLSRGCSSVSTEVKWGIRAEASCVGTLGL